MRRALVFALFALGRAAPAPVVPLGDLGELHICSDRIIRVVRWPTSAPVNKTSLVAKADWPEVPYKTSTSAGVLSVETSSLIVKHSQATDTITFVDKSNNQVVLQESGHEFQKTMDMGKDTYQVEQSWYETSRNEGLYGGGSYQNGVVNFKNAPVEMIQFNTEAVLPFFWSTSGYALLWDNYAWTYLNPPVEKPLVAPGTRSNGSVDFVPQADGDHFFFVGRSFPVEGEGPKFGAGGNQLVQVNITNEEGVTTVVQSWDKIANMPNSLTGLAPGLKQGRRYRIDYRWTPGDVGLFVRGPEYGKTVLRSFLGESVDYYFVLAPSGDAAVRGYREITGAAPLYAKWVYGFWQCKEHYDTQAHVLEAAQGFRARSIPIDSIVQDWLYWGSLGWGPQWDPKVYPHPAAMMEQLRSLKIHFMASVWSKFANETKFYKEMAAKGWLLGELGAENYYDAWNPDARQLFYNFSKSAHFSIGVDSLWLDATEPENFPNKNTMCYLGSGNAYMNSYSLMTTQAIADGLRRDYPQAQGARVFSLTRSSFAGQQRTGAALWSGDTQSTWDSLRRQVAASINYQMSGIPYWAQDIGGFFRPNGQYSSEDYHDMLTRWFQFGVFTPIFRVHGAHSTTEIWNYGEETMHNINASAISLRYRLLPYIYSGFARAEFEGYTMQRGLPMDFKEERVRSIADEFMWGDAFLVAPIHTPAGAGKSATARSVYLPLGASWVNFHTGESHLAGQTEVAFKLSEAPVFVRAGSIVPLGPLVQNTAERTDPIELRVYRGSDASFALFEDDGASRAYRDGSATRITFTWSESRGELSISQREGSFEGMLQNRTFNIVWVKPGHGVGVAPGAVDVPVHYSGAATSVKFRDSLWV